MITTNSPVNMTQPKPTYIRNICGCARKNQIEIAHSNSGYA